MSLIDLLNEYRDLKQQRARMGEMSIKQLYDLSFEAHYNLPWADGNGRMARLLMSMLQLEAGLIPSKVISSRKFEYIKALVETREEENLSIFLDFMHRMLEDQLKSEIKAFLDSTNQDSLL